MTNEEKCDYLLQYMTADTQTGMVYWTKSTNKKIAVGSPAGAKDKQGYTILCCNGVKVKRHRFIFYVAHGYLPKMVDHKKGVEFGDGIENLREATPARNSRNRGEPKTKTGTGVKGVQKISNSDRYFSTIRHNGKGIYLGSYDTIEEAKEAYEKKALELFGEDHRGNK